MKKALSILTVGLVVFSLFATFASSGKSQPEKLASGDETWGFAINSDYVYFAEFVPVDGRIRRVAKTGGAVTTLATGIPRICCITVDSEYVYYVDQGSGHNGKVIRMGKNGENPTVLASGLIWAFGITQDTDYIYFSEGQVHVATGYIKKVPKIGGPITTLATTNSPQGLVVDSNCVYFTSDRYTASKINRVNKDGTNPVTLASGLQTNVDDLAIDDEYVYFYEYTAYQDYVGRVGRVPKIGGAVEISASEQDNPGAVDVDSDYVYFSESGAGNIKRVPKSGGQVETLASGYPGTGTVIVESNYLYYSVANWGDPHPLNGVYRLQLTTEAVVDIDPDTLNLKSKGKWITCYIELPEGYDVGDINVSTILLNDTVPAEMHPVGIGDEDGDGIPDLMVKFDRTSVIDYIEDHIDWYKPERTKPLIYQVTLTIIGMLYDGTPFEGSDTIRTLKFLKGQPTPK